MGGRAIIILVLGLFIVMMYFSSISNRISGQAVDNQIQAFYVEKAKADSYSAIQIFLRKLYENVNYTIDTTINLGANTSIHVKIFAKKYHTNDFSHIVPGIGSVMDRKKMTITATISPIDSRMNPITVVTTISLRKKSFANYAFFVPGTNLDRILQKDPTSNLAVDYDVDGPIHIFGASRPSTTTTSADWEPTENLPTFNFPLTAEYTPAAFSNLFTKNSSLYNKGISYGINSVNIGNSAIGGTPNTVRWSYWLAETYGGKLTNGTSLLALKISSNLNKIYYARGTNADLEDYASYISKFLRNDGTAPGATINNDTFKFPIICFIGNIIIKRESTSATDINVGSVRNPKGLTIVAYDDASIGPGFTNTANQTGYGAKGNILLADNFTRCLTGITGETGKSGMLGLVASNNVLLSKFYRYYKNSSGTIINTSNGHPYFHVSIFCEKGGFGVEDLSRLPNPNNAQVIYLRGSLTQKINQKINNLSSPTTQGYQKDFSWGGDQWHYAAPPGFPHTDKYELILWDTKVLIPEIYH